MDRSVIESKLTDLFKLFAGHSPESLFPLAQSGSNRVYYRMSDGERSVIGAYNEDVKENEAFYSFTRSFAGLNVPELLKVSDDKLFYLQTDLGDETLFNAIKNNKKTSEGKSHLCFIKKSLLGLIELQVTGAKSIDFSKCYPRSAFDRQSIQWDLNYFKYEFLKLAGISFDEQKLEVDFQNLIEYLLSADGDYFMFRDFQSRNVMIIDDEAWFIDYQGGRKGPLQYDLASMLYSPKTGLNAPKREALLDFYLQHLEEKIEVNREQFKAYYYSFALVRILQALGAYGYRGIFEKKANFRKSIPIALQNIYELFQDELISIDLPELKRLSTALIQSEWAKPYILPVDKLTIRITSFSYKNGIPDDPSENGGGFAFDCRGLPNPGRFKEYRSYSGLDEKVQSYLMKHPEVEEFQQNVQKVVRVSIEEYLRRGFNHLCVNFGCTGGQHRSVYNAEKFSEWVLNNYPVKVVLIHTEKNNWRKQA